MNISTLIEQLGNDADLLTRNDDWLEVERHAKVTELNALFSELQAIVLAQKIKTQLQQKNLVAVQHIENDENATIRLMSLPDALKLLAKPKSKLEAVNRTAQITGWRKDGYDIEASSKLREDNDLR